MFWLHGEDLPPDVGNERFCAMHLVYIAFFFGATLIYALLYRKLSLRARMIADRITGSVVFFFGLCEYGITALIGRFDKYTLPIHICSLMFSLILIHAWTNKAAPGSCGAKLHAFLSSVIFHPGILGTWAALLFPDWLYYPFWNYLSICGFMVHGCMSVYGASVIVNGAEAPDRLRVFLRDLRNSVLFLLIGGGIMYLFDTATGTNYWFVAGPGYGSPLMFAYEKSGFTGYLLALVVTGTVLTALWYGLRYLLFVRKKKK